MPALGNGTETIKILLSQVSKDMHEPLVLMIFPSFGAHLSGVEFQYSDLKMGGDMSQIGVRMAKNDGNKGLLSHVGIRNISTISVH